MLTASAAATSFLCSSSCMYYHFFQMLLLQHESAEDTDISAELHCHCLVAGLLTAVPSDPRKLHHPEGLLLAISTT